MDYAGFCIYFKLYIMPNYIQNRLSILGNENEVKRCLSFITDDKGLIDFEKIIPVGDRPDWYDTRVNLWGCKWNAGDREDKRNTDNTLFFTTAWNAPFNLILKLSDIFKNIEFELFYSDEDSGYNTGKITFEKGKYTSIYQPKGGSKEAMDFYIELHPDSNINHARFGSKQP